MKQPKSIRTSLALVLALGGIMGCDEPEPTEAAATAEGSATAVAAGETTDEAPGLVASLANVLARIGGARVLAGNMVVEVVPSADGEIIGVVSKADGEAATISKLTVKVEGEDGETKEVELTWDAERSVYVGQADSALRTGPVHVEVEADGETVEGDYEAVAVAPAALIGGQVVVLGDVAAEVRVDPRGVIQVVELGSQQRLDGSGQVTVSVPMASGEVADVPLVWDADASAYIGGVSEGVTLGSGAIGVSLVRGTTTVATRVQTVPIKAPEHEGDIVVAGDYTVELKPGADDQLEAWVYDAQGQAVADADLSLQLAAGAEATRLVWNPQASVYVVAVPPSVDITTTPVRVRVRRGNRVHRGSIAASGAPAFGRNWRARVDAGAGGAIPPGQRRRVVTVVDIRANPGVRGAMARVRVRERGAGMGMGNVRVRVGGASAMAMGGVQVRGPNVPMVQVQAPNVRVQAPGAAVRVNVGMGMGMAGGMVTVVRPSAPMVALPMAPMVSAPMVSVGAGASAMGMASGMRRGGMASAMGGVSIMIGR